jgi:predicted PurR-regulated permease PerM
LKRTPEVVDTAQTKLKSIRRSISRAQRTTKQLQEVADLDGQLKAKVATGPSLAEQIFAQARSAVVTLVVILMLIYFLLARGRKTLLQLEAGMEGDRRHMFDVLDQIRREITRYLRTFTLINLVLGLVTTLAMALLGMPSPVLWGLLAGTLNFMPYLGPAVTLVIIAAVAVVTFETALAILLPPLVFLVLTTLEGQLITPMILGRHLTINPILLFVGILFWAWVWGVPGALLAVPITATLKIVVTNVESLRPLRGLFA